MKFDVELVGKIGSMALVDSEHGELDYNRFVRISRFLRPGMIWVSSGAAVIGRLDYERRSGGRELAGEPGEVKADYAAQGQAILMQTYRSFIDERWSVRQVLVEHNHFNDAVKREHIKGLLLRCAAQGAIPIVNYNDPVSDEENRKWEIEKLRAGGGSVVELVDNDETAAQVACLVHAGVLLILTNLDGIYRDVHDERTLIREISGSTADEVIAGIDEAKRSCVGSSREGAAGAGAKLEYIKPCVRQGTKVIIASSRYAPGDVLAGRTPCTVISVR